MMPLFGNAVRRLPAARAAARNGFLLLGFAASLRAADLPAPVTLDLPIAANRALPAWVGQPEVPATIFGTLNLPLLAPDPSASLLVTVYFHERQSGFLRLIWKGSQSAEVLTDNFYENIGMANQRSLLISADTLGGDGTLMLQSSDTKLGVQRIKLEWLENKGALISPEIRDLLVTSASGQTLRSLDLSGAPASAPAGAWDDQIVTVPMTDAPVRIEQGVDFSIDLDQVPGAARVALEETGLPLGQRLVVWVNEQRAGTMTPAVPDLRDGGYLASEDKRTSAYVGWREASFYPPVSILKAGVNSIQFSVEEDTNATTASTTPATSANAPLAIKSLVMQLNYTPATDGAAPVAAAPAEPAAPPESTPAEATAVQTAAIIPPLATTRPSIEPLPDLPLPQLMAPANPNLRPAEITPAP